MRRLTVTLCFAVPLALSACGTTVPVTQAGSGGAGLDLALEPSSPSSGSFVGSAPSGTTAGTAAPAAGGDPAATSGPGAGQGPARVGGGVTAGVVTTGRGVTPTTITIGFPVATGTEALASSFGISGAGTVPAQDIIAAVVRDVNDSGGVLGRRLAAQVHAFDAAEGIANPEQTMAAICADFRDDHPVFAAVFDIVMPSLRKCLADMGSPLVVRGGFAVVPAAAYAEEGGSFLYGPDAITTERLAELFIESLMARSFTTKWNIATGGPGATPLRLGVIHVDTPDQNALYASYAKELAKHGLVFSDTVTYTQDAQAALAATQNAVLKFRANGVTHVFGASAFFLQAAESQGYRPRYAYLPGLGSIGTDNSPAAQLRGALTVGWTPTSDVKAAQDPGVTAAGRRCQAAMRKASLSTANRVDLQLMYAVCDAVYALRDALVVAGEPTVPGLRRGFESLGSRFSPALTFGARLGPGRHHGVDAVRDMAWDSDCPCLVYTSRTNRS